MPAIPNTLVAHSNPHVHRVSCATLGAVRQRIQIQAQINAKLAILPISHVWCDLTHKRGFAERESWRSLIVSMSKILDVKIHRAGRSVECWHLDAQETGRLKFGGSAS